MYLYFSNFSAEDGLKSEIGSLHCELEQKQSCITESGERLNKIMVWSISIHVLLKITESSGSEKTKWIHCNQITEFDYLYEKQLNTVIHAYSKDMY